MKESMALGIARQLLEFQMYGGFGGFFEISKHIRFGVVY